MSNSEEAYGRSSQHELLCDPDECLEIDALLELWDNYELCYYAQDSLREP